MPIDRYCILKECRDGGECVSKLRPAGKPCVYEYVRQPDGSPDAPYNWAGDDPPPKRWRMANGTVVYRCLADFYDD